MFWTADETKQTATGRTVQVHEEAVLLTSQTEQTATGRTVQVHDEAVLLTSRPNIHFRSVTLTTVADGRTIPL